MGWNLGRGEGAAATAAAVDPGVLISVKGCNGLVGTEECPGCPSLRNLITWFRGPGREMFLWAQQARLLSRMASLLSDLPDCDISTMAIDIKREPKTCSLLSCH